MTRITTIILFIISSSLSFGQIGNGVEKKKRKEIPMLKERALKVVLNDEDDNLTEFWKIAMKDYWSFTDSYEFITMDEYLEYGKNRKQSTDVAFLKYIPNDLQANVPGDCIAIGLGENKIFTHFVNVSVLEGNRTLADLILALGRLQYDLNEEEFNGKKFKADRKEKIAAIQQALNNKTLLVNQDLIDDKGLEMLESTYPFSKKLVTKQEMDQAIINKDENSLLLMPVEYAKRPSAVTNWDKVPFTKTTNETTRLRDLSFGTIAIVSPEKSEIITPINVSNEKIGKNDIQMLMRVVSF